MLTKRIQNIELPITFLLLRVFADISKSKLYPVCFKWDCIFSIVKCYFYVMNHANHEVSGNVVCLFYIEYRRQSTDGLLEVFSF